VFSVQPFGPERLDLSSPTGLTAEGAFSVQGGTGGFKAGANFKYVWIELETGVKRREEQW
jgi:hypothetical protein